MQFTDYYIQIKIAKFLQYFDDMISCRLVKFDLKILLEFHGYTRLCKISFSVMKTEREKVLMSGRIPIKRLLDYTTQSIDIQINYNDPL